MDDSSQRNCVPMRALGRRFQIGTLYNYQQDVIIPGTYLWDPEDVRSKIRRTKYRKQKINIHLADDSQEKRSQLRIDDHLLMSLLAKLVSDVGGASKYVDDHCPADQVIVCLHCRVKLAHEEVDPDSMKKFEFLCQDRVLRQGSATHVVVGITYGLESFCVARRPVEEDEDKVDVQDELREWLEHWRQCLLDEEVSFDRPPDGISCRLYTDIPLQSETQDLADYYSHCLNILKAADKCAVPQIVWLYPLHQITPKARRYLGREVSKEAVDQCLHLWDQMRTVKQEVDDLKVKIKADHSPLAKDIESFGQMIQGYQALIDDRLRGAINEVRSGSGNDSVIGDVVSIIRESPFDPHRLGRLIHNKLNLLDIIQNVASIAKIPVIFDQNLIQQSTKSRTLVLRIPSLGQENQVELQQMKLYVQNSNFIRWPHPMSDQVNIPEASSHQIQSEVVRFSKFIADNVQTNDVEYWALYDGQCQDSAVRYQWYGKGVVIFPQVDLPPVPLNLRVAENRHGKIRLQWQCGKVACFSSYAIEYREERETHWKRIHSNKSRSYEFQNLKSGVAYYFRLAIVTALGIGSFTQQVGPEVVESLCGPPRSIKLKQSSDTSLSFSWLDPVHDASISITGYLVEYWPEANRKVAKSFKSKQRQTQIDHLKRGQKYQIRVTAVCGQLGNGVPSAPVRMQTDAGPPRVACVVRDVSQLSASDSISSLKVYNLPIKEEILGKTIKIRHCQFGVSLNKFRRKTILVVGPTGAGKTTLINGMINYILGVKWKDDFRFKLIREPPKTQAHSQTDHVTAYDIFHMRGSNVNYSLTIVDTPGFGDTRGLERDRMIIEQIRQYFQSPDGIQELEAVCFLLQAPLARLTPSQKYIYDSILSLFGKDIKDNIRLMITFADNQEPPVLAAIQESNIPYPVLNGRPFYYKFNNSSLMTPKSVNPQHDAFNKMFFEMGAQSFARFFADLNRMKTTSLTLTKEVLLERKKLEVVVEGLQQRIQYGLNQIEEFKQIKKALTENVQQMQDNRNFNFQVEFSVQQTIDISGTGNFVTNCQKCKWSCHYPCKYANDADRQSCLAMDQGYCRVCPGKCSWRDHFNQKYKYEWVKKRVDRSSNEIRKQYEDAQKKKLSNQELIDQLARELKSCEKSIVDLVNVTYPSIRRLDEIALRPHPFSAPEYIDLIIKAEQQEHRDGYMHRIETLQKLKQMAEIQSKVIKRQSVFDASFTRKS